MEGIRVNDICVVLYDTQFFVKGDGVKIISKHFNILKGEYIYKVHCVEIPEQTSYIPHSYLKCVFRDS